MVLQRAPNRAVIWGYGPASNDNTTVLVTLTPENEGQGSRSDFKTVIRHTGITKGTID